MNYKKIITALIAVNKETKKNKSLYSIKEKVIRKLIAHGQLKGDSFHSFSRGGYSLSLKSKHAKCDETGKKIGEFHSTPCNNMGKFKGNKFDGLLPSAEDKSSGFYKAPMNIGEALSILEEFLQDNSFSKAKASKNLAIAKRKNYLV